MAKMFGKRSKSAPAQAVAEPISSIAAAPLPRHAGPPASSTPLADHLAPGGPGVSEGYVVVPRSLAEQMPLPWQQQMAALLAQFHGTHRDLSWPVYRVIPSREEKLVDLDEEQLAEAGYLLEIDTTGDVVYRERNGRKVADPEGTVVLVSCLDPIPARTRPARPPAGAADRPPAPRAPVPMNIGPQPVWDTVPGRSRQPASPPPGIAQGGRQEPGTPPPGIPQGGRQEPGTPPPGIPQGGRQEPGTPPPGISQGGRQEPGTPPPGIPQAQSQQQTVAYATPTVSSPPAAPPVRDSGEGEAGDVPPARSDRKDPIDWYAETPEAGFEPIGPVDPLDEPSDFGPTGEPIERPYRYRP